MGKILYCDPKIFEELVHELAYKIVNSAQYKSIYGVPRGGIYIAIALSQVLHIPIVDKDKIEKNTLVVDDLIDSGKTRNRYPNNTFACLYGKNIETCVSSQNIITYIGNTTNRWVEFFWERATGEQPAEDAITRILELIGENPNRPGLKDTPKRIIKMYQEIFRGYDEIQKPQITIFKNHEDGIRTTGILRDSGYFFSFCEHHMLPFFGHYWYGYIPDKLVMGASKIARIVDYYSAKLQVAERLCYDIIEEIEKQTRPKGSILIMKARHLCKEMRGVKKIESPYEVSEVRGVFKDNKLKCRDEFLSRISLE